MVFSGSLKRREDFAAIYKKGRSFSDANMVIRVRKNGSEYNRIGFSASGKYGNSVVRHAFFRRIRAIYRLNETSFVRGVDIVIIARKNLTMIIKGKDPYRVLEHSFLTLSDKAGIRQ